VVPASRCSRVSPTQAMTFNPLDRAYATLSPTNYKGKEEEHFTLCTRGDRGVIMPKQPNKKPRKGSVSKK